MSNAFEEGETTDSAFNFIGSCVVVLAAPIRARSELCMEIPRLAAVGEDLDEPTKLVASAFDAAVLEA